MISQLDVHEIKRYGNVRGNIMIRNRMLVFFTGFCLGMMFFLWKKTYITDKSGFLGQEVFVQLVRIQLEQYELIKYIVRNRGIQFCILILAACNRRINRIVNILLTYGGFLTAIFMLTLAYRYGVKGIFLWLLMIFPHGIFYLILFCILFHKKEDDDTKYYHKSNWIKEKRYYKVLTEIVKWIVIIMLFVMGVVAECYICPILVTRFAMFL